MASGAWERLGIDKKRLAGLINFSCDPAFEFQIEVIAIRDQTFWLAHSDLIQPEFFGNQLSALFMSLVHAFNDSYGSVPDHTVARDLAARHPSVPPNMRHLLLQHIDAVYSTQPANGVYLSDRVREMARKRALRAAVVRVAELNEASSDDSCLDDIQEVMGAALSLSARDTNPVISAKSNYNTILNWCIDYGDDAVPLMLPSADKVLRGGILPGELGVILAPPNRGKSLILCNLACAAQVAGNDVLFISNEDGLKGIGPRILARMTGVPVSDLGLRSSEVVVELKKIFRMFNADLRIVYRPPSKTSCSDIRALLERLANNDHFRPKLVIIDYADRLRPPRKRKEKWDDLVDIYMELHAIAVEMGVAIWTASQANREGFDSDIIDLNQMAGAFQKAGEADIVAAFCQSKAERDAGEARLYFAKVRNRASGSIMHLYVNRENSTVTEVPADKIPLLISTQKKSKKQPDPQQNTPSAIASGFAPPAKQKKGP